VITAERGIKKDGLNSNVKLMTVERGIKKGSFKI
jgi:hypothetical protein